jgi:Zn-dependent M28 family amino/carboxypeptidase
VPSLIPRVRRASLAAVLVGAAAAAARAAVGLPPSIGDEDPFRHVQALQDVASTNGGNRASGTPGYDRSAEYVAEQLRLAGYAVRLEDFPFPFFEERSPPVLVFGHAGPDSSTARPEELRILGNSGSGDVTAPLRPVDVGLSEEPLRASTSACEREDFADFVPGHIALVRRGTCPFQTKVEHAQTAGAAAVIIMNQGTGEQTGTFAGRLATLASIPVLGVTTEVGRRLNMAAGNPSGIEVRLKTDVETGTRSTRNVIAERTAQNGNFIVVGGHLDSVLEGPGMNDNASGSAAVLETALRLAREPQTGTPVRFAFWGAEERGLLGSRHHLNALSEEERRRIALYINLDMVGSPNFGRFIQLTQETKSEPAAGIVQALTDYLGEYNLPVEQRTGRQRGFGSDDASFASKSIPTIGLFTGAAETKSQAHSGRFGGSSGQPFDPCYHKACDTALNVNRQVLGQITDALIHALRRPASPAVPPG